MFMPTILIADDEPIMRMDLCDMVSDLGFTVVGEAADGFDAIELCRLHHPDVVLMDVKMPIFDGLTAAETILAEDLAGCVVVVTAFADAAFLERASAVGVTGYLVKPIDQRSLLPTIEVAREQARRLRQSREDLAAAEEKLRQDRIIHKAQTVYAQQNRCTEEEAYRLLRKTAMDKRMTMAMLAQHILHQADQNDPVRVVKHLLMTRKSLPEEKAYQHIVSYGKVHDLSVEEAAKVLRGNLERE